MLQYSLDELAGCIRDSIDHCPGKGKNSRVPPGKARDPLVTLPAK